MLNQFLVTSLDCAFCLQEDVDHDESYVDGPRSSTLPEHWQTFSNTAAAAHSNGGSSSTVGQRGFVRQESQVSGLQAPAGVVQMQQGSAEQMKVGFWGLQLPGFDLLQQKGRG
jgi:hypothetical protein